MNGIKKLTIKGNGNEIGILENGNSVELIFENFGQKKEVVQASSPQILDLIYVAIFGSKESFYRDVVNSGNVAS